MSEQYLTIEHLSTIEIASILAVSVLTQKLTAGAGLGQPQVSTPTPRLKSATSATTSIGSCMRGL